MARIVNGTIFVASFNSTAVPGEYTISGATWNNQSDVEGVGASLVVPGYKMFIPAASLATGDPIPGIVHRYAITAVTVLGPDSLDLTILWDEEGPEVDTPVSGVTCGISEATTNKLIGLPPAEQVYNLLAPGSSIASLNLEARNVLDPKTVPEAPADGKTYGRKDLAWAEVSGGGGDSYTNTTPTTASLGGIPIGSTFASQTMPQMFDALLYPYQNPTFTSFSISGQTTPLEVGASILANRTFVWGTSNSGNINPNSIEIRDVTGAVDLATGLANDGSEAITMSAITRNSAGSQQFRIRGTNTHSAIFEVFYSVAWQWRRYYGEDALTVLDQTGIKNLRINGLASGFAGTYAFAAGGYKYLSYPAVLGTATTFKDTGTNLDVPFEPAYLVSVTNALGVNTNYNVHRTTNIIGSAINIAVS